MDKVFDFWDKSPRELAEMLDSSAGGLSSAEAERRLAAASGRRARPALPPFLRLLLSQFNNFITLILLLSALLSIALKDRANGVIILCILLVTGFLGFRQERGAERAIKKLAEMVSVTARILRDGKPVEISAAAVVPGDVVILSAGDMIPGDALVLEAKDFFADESALTGETFPAEKRAGPAAADGKPGDRVNAIFFGTHAVSGTARAMIAAVGADTRFGEIKSSLSADTRTTDFQRGLMRFSAFLAKITLSLILAIFFFNVFFHRHILESFMFSLALAVGLTPQLLPAVVSVNLAYGARRMADKRVIVQRLASIENLGSIDTLCSDKTGTLTTGRIRLMDSVDADGGYSERALACALVNAVFQTGFANPLDEAVKTAAAEAGLSHEGWKRVDEVPYDFIRKRLSIMVEISRGKRLCITKGAYKQISAVCTSVERGGEPGILTPEIREAMDSRFRDFGGNGRRAIAVAVRDMGAAAALSKDDERDMTFVGFLSFEDPIKEDAVDLLLGLREIGISLKIITGDSAGVAETVARQAGLKNPRVVTGSELRERSGAALPALAQKTDVFAEVEPNQKESIILALRKRGHTVGYLGDGINDIPALNAADVGISAGGAVDAAKQAADMILLERDLGVLIDGVIAGRRTFANTMKYIFMATSANFGNMFSMACAAVFLPFLPLLPKQILLTNLLTDMPEMAMSGDNVDPESLRKPQKWDIDFIRAFMFRFGLLSSCFDLITFFVLLRAPGGGQSLVRTGWFVYSVISAVAAVLLMRTAKPFYRSRPNKPLTAACAAAAAAAAAMPYLAVTREIFGFVRLPLSFFACIAVIVLAYTLSVELTKRFFYPQKGRGRRRRAKGFDHYLFGRF